MSKVFSSWRTLQERERIRTYLAKRTRGETFPCQYPSPEYVFYSVDNSRSDTNRRKNRYNDVLAYDRSTVFVGGNTDAYLNANVVVDPVGNWWVAAQAPMPHTFYDFFRAIQTRSASKSCALPAGSGATGASNGVNNGASNRSSGASNGASKPSAILVQLTNCVERGMQKADPYLPETAHTFTSPEGKSITLSLLDSSARPDLGGRYSVLDLEGMDLHHYHFTEWPDHGVPEGGAVHALKNLLNEVYSKREALGGQDACELWVHCSAGIGRTGAFLALMSINFPPSGSARPPSKSPLAEMDPRPRDTIAHTVDTMRDYRNYLVQTSEQLELVYEMTSAW